MKLRVNFWSLRRPLLAGLCTVLVGGFWITPVVGQEEAEKEAVDISGNITVVGRATDGNSRNKTLSMSTEWVRKVERSRFTVLGLWNYGEDEGGVNVRNASGIAKYDYFHDERRYSYISTLAESDTFAALILRATIGGGMGYQFFDKKLDSKPYAFYEELGVSYVDNDFRRPAGTENVDDAYAAVRISGKLDWDWSETSEIFHFHEAYFGLENIEDVNVSAQQGIRTQMKGNLYTTFQVNLKWDNTPAKGVRRLDVEYLIGLTYTF